jgi:predicted transcriptional regulator
MPKTDVGSSHNRESSTTDPSTKSRSLPSTGRAAKTAEPKLQRLTGCLQSLASRHHDLIQGYAARVGIAGMQYTILTTIRYFETRGDVFPVTIAEHLRLTSAGVTKAIQHLTELGLVEKAGDSG